MPKIVDKDLKRREIAGIALALFAEQGFENTPVREITSRAGMGKGTLYDYFRNKEEILSEIVQLIFDEWNTLIISKIRASEDPIEQLRIMVKEGANLGDTLKQAMIMYVDLWRRSVSKKGSDEVMATFRRHLTDSKEKVAALIAVAQIKGLIKKEVDPEGLAFSLIALMDGMCLHAMLFKDELDMDSLSESIFEMLLTGIKGLGKKVLS